MSQACNSAPRFLSLFNYFTKEWPSARMNLYLSCQLSILSRHITSMFWHWKNTLPKWISENGRTFSQFWVVQMSPYATVGASSPVFKRCALGGASIIRRPEDFVFLTHYLQKCRKIRGLGCMNQGCTRARVTQPSPHIFLHICILLYFSVARWHFLSSDLVKTGKIWSRLAI